MSETLADTPSYDSTEGGSPLLAAFVLTIALSIDSFVTGVIYGTRHIAVPNQSLIIIGVCTGMGMAFSMYMGEFVAGFISTRGADIAGGIILVAIGIYRSIEAWPAYVGTHIDRDKSSVIDPSEAFTLAIALGLDSMAAGFAAAMLGFHLAIVLPVALTSMLFIRVGTVAGRRINDKFMNGKAVFIPGIVLIAMGVFRL